MEKTTTFYWLSFGFQLEIVTLIFDSKDARDNRADFERSQGHEVFTGESLNSVEISDDDVLGYLPDMDADEVLSVLNDGDIAEYMEYYKNYLVLECESLSDTMKADFLRENWGKITLPPDIY